ncbi:MAG: hypothetical protein ACOY3E_10955 [Pseudomonadota bacterium]
MNKILVSFIAGLAIGAASGWCLKPKENNAAIAELKPSVVPQNTQQDGVASAMQPLGGTHQGDATRAPPQPVTASQTTSTAVSQPAAPAMPPEALQGYHGALREMMEKPRDRKGEWERPFFNEARDDAWSTAAEDRVRAKVLSNVAAQRFPPKSIECRRSGCRIEYRFRTLDDYEAFDRDYRPNHIFPGTSIMGNGTSSEDGDQVYVEYIQRNDSQP